MQITNGSAITKIFSNAEFLNACADAMDQTIADIEDATKDPKFKRQIKINIVVSPSKKPGIYGAAATVQSVLSPTVCNMSNQKQMSMDDVDKETGEIKEA